MAAYIASSAYQCYIKATTEEGLFYTGRFPFPMRECNEVFIYANGRERLLSEWEVGKHPLSPPLPRRSSW